MLFMIFGAFNVAVQRPRRPSDHIDRIIRRRPPIHGTWHIRLAALSDTAAATRGRHCAHGGVFVVLFVVNEKEDTHSFNLRLRWRIFRLLCR